MDVGSTKFHFKTSKKAGNAHAVPIPEMRNGSERKYLHRKRKYLLSRTLGLRPYLDVTMEPELNFFCP